MLEEGKFKDARWHRSWIAAGFVWVSVEKVACAAPVSLCCVNAMTSYLVCVVRRVKHEGEQRMLLVCVQQSQCAGLGPCFPQQTHPSLYEHRPIIVT